MSFATLVYSPKYGILGEYGVLISAAVMLINVFFIADIAFRGVVIRLFQEGADHAEIIDPQQPGVQRGAGVVDDTAGDGGQGDADEGRGQGLALSMAVFVLPVGGLAADVDEEQDHGVGDQVRQRVDGVRRHGGASAAQSGDELETREQHVDGTARQGHAADGFFPFVHITQSYCFRGIKQKLAIFAA